ncbi:MAG: thioesterase family protein [Candidatus Promineifilaceae bacterium]
MSGEFTRRFRVRWSEMNANGQVSLAGYFRYLMETAWDWGASGGLGFAENEALGLAWLIQEMEIELYRPLSAGEVFDFTIWLLEWRRMRGTRCFELRLAEGNKLVARGAQKVVVLDSKSFRPVRVPEEIMANFTMENPRSFERQQFPEFEADPEKAYRTQRVIEWRDLDLLNHVNNATYADFAEQTAVLALDAMGWPPSRFQAEGLIVQNQRFHIRYKSPALWGEALDVSASLMDAKPEGGTWFMQMERPSGEIVSQCTLGWAVVDRTSGEVVGVISKP